MIYKIIPDDAVRTGTLLSGESQYIDEVDPLQLADLQENPDIVVVQQGQPGSGYILLFNVARTDSPQADVAVRRALSYAVDKEAMNQAVWGGIFSPAASPLMKPTFGYEPKTEEVYTYDPRKANSMLDEAGWVLNGEMREKDGQPLTLYWPTQDRPNDNGDGDVHPGRLARGRRRRRRRADGAGRVRRKTGGGRLRPRVPLVLLCRPRHPAHDLLSRATSATSTSPTTQPRGRPDAARRRGRDRSRGAAGALLPDPTADAGDAVTIPLGDSITYNAKRANLEGDFLDFLASYVWMNDAHFTGVDVALSLAALRQSKLPAPSRPSHAMRATSTASQSMTQHDTVHPPQAGCRRFPSFSASPSSPS